jgi:hypothetical protein
VRVSAPTDSQPTESAAERQGILASLPRTRPQRASPRRAAARKANATASAKATTSAKAKAKATTKAGANGSKSRKRTRTAPKRPAPIAEPVPRQGFACESDSDRASGPVQPPGGAELVAGAAELIGELAKAGISTGERVLRDVLSRLPLS